jgi:hypothetical protein
VVIIHPEAEDGKKKTSEEARDDAVFTFVKREFKLEPLEKSTATA